MPQASAKLVISHAGLTPAEYDEIMELASACNANDQITLKLNPSILQSRPLEEKSDFLYYVDGKLVGYCGLYQFNQQEVECSGMVHPNHRRNGIFSALLSEAKQEIRRRGVKKLILINSKDSTNGHSFLKSIGAEYTFSEYWMKLNQTKVSNLVHSIQLRPAQPTDIRARAHMLAVCFHMNETEEVESISKKPVGKPNHREYVVDLHGTSIGTLSINTSQSDSAFIYGLCVLPDFQGHGYGRQALNLAIHIALFDNRTNIELEVACENMKALSLYESCGFQVLRANDYFVQMIES